MSTTPTIPLATLLLNALHQPGNPLYTTRGHSVAA